MVRGFRAGMAFSGTSSLVLCKFNAAICKEERGPFSSASNMYISPLLCACSVPFFLFFFAVTLALPSGLMPHLYISNISGKSSMLEHCHERTWTLYKCCATRCKKFRTLESPHTRCVASSLFLRTRFAHPWNTKQLSNKTIVHSWCSVTYCSILDFPDDSGICYTRIKERRH